MSMYDDEVVLKTFQCTKHQANRLKLYCRYKRISGSQLLRLFIDELRLDQYDTSVRRKVEEIGYKIDNLLGNHGSPPIQETINDEAAGKKESRWFSKKFFS